MLPYSIMIQGTSKRSRRGFSLVELLVVVAIIALLLAITLPVYGRGIHKAKDTATKEAMRQKKIGQAADNANSVGTIAQVDYNRPRARSAFVQRIDTGKEERLITEMIFVVKNDREFSAYWHTLIDINNTDPIQKTADGKLIAFDEFGERFELPPMEEGISGGHPQFWDLVTVDQRYMTALSTILNVTYADGHVDTVRYPAKFPITPKVAKLTQRHLEGM